MQHGLPPTNEGDVGDIRPVVVDKGRFSFAGKVSISEWRFAELARLRAVPPLAESLAIQDGVAIPGTDLRNTVPKSWNQIDEIRARLTQATTIPPAVNARA